MEEETLYDRIGDADLNPTYKDGQVYQHTDVNNMLSILKTAINENYYDIQRILNGDKTAGEANVLDGATLSRYLDELLQANDNKIPSSQQVKAYVDNLFADFTPPVRGIDYWTEEDKQEIIEETETAVMTDVDSEIDEAIQEMRQAAFAAFDVIDGELIASYSREDEDYYFQLNGNNLEVVINES